MKKLSCVGISAALAALLLMGCDAGAQKATPPAEAPAAATNNNTGGKTMSFHDFTMKDIYGKDKPLADYRGKVVLAVNVASQCGYTPQYEGLEKLHEKYADRGLVVTGFPANDFGAQEPGPDSEIATFCTSKYGVKFPMFSKITVKGAEKNPLYAFLTQAAPAGEVKWNFEKFLVGKDGQVVGRFPSSVTPESETLIQAIEKALGS
jgi:glutathione peroxidase